MKVSIGPYRKNRAERVIIEPHDTYNMDQTLAMIIHPMLVQLKTTKHGYPSELSEDRWDQILDDRGNFPPFTTYYYPTIRASGRI